MLARVKINLYICYITTISLNECLIDNNECCVYRTQDNNCTVYCNNAEGSFQCVCDIGYTLLAENKIYQESKLTLTILGVSFLCLCYSYSLR